MSKKHLSPESQPKEIVRHLLRTAFGTTRNGKTPLSHKDCLDMRSKLIMVETEELPFYLGRVLEDLLDTHTSTLGRPEDADVVVQYLDASGQGPDLDFVGSQYGENARAKARDDASFLRAEKLRDFASLGQAQAIAICRWLQLAHDWPELKWYGGQIDSAIRFWSEKALL